VMAGFTFAPVFGTAVLIVTGVVVDTIPSLLVEDRLQPQPGR
jgi:hypothetical protein